MFKVLVFFFSHFAFHMRLIFVVFTCFFWGSVSQTEGAKTPSSKQLDFEITRSTTWMSQEVSKWLVNGLFHLLINGVYWGYTPLTNHLLTSWDIQVVLYTVHFGHANWGTGFVSEVTREVLSSTIETGRFLGRKTNINAFP